MGQPKRKGWLLHNKKSSWQGHQSLFYPKEKKQSRQSKSQSREKEVNQGRQEQQLGEKEEDYSESRVKRVSSTMKVGSMEYGEGRHEEPPKRKKKA